MQPDWRRLSQQDRDLGLNNGVGRGRKAATWSRAGNGVSSEEMRGAGFRSSRPQIRPRRERNRIDFFKAAEEKRRTVLFIHGGYWQMRAQGSFFCDYLPLGPLAHGINVATIGYTLAPEATLDEIVGRNPPGPGIILRKKVARAWAATRAGSWCPAGPRAGIWPSMGAGAIAAVKAGIAISGHLRSRADPPQAILTSKLGLDEAMSPAVIRRSCRPVGRE